MTFEITKATVTVTPDSGQSKVYGDLEPTLTWTASGLTNGDTVSVFTGALDRAAGENVGTYLIGLGDLDAGSNYTTVLDAAPVTFEITKATVTVTPDSGQSKVYGDLEPTLTWTASGLTNGDTVSVFTGALDRATGENVGTYLIGLGDLDAGSNYTTVLDAAPVTFEITKATVTVTPDSGQSKVYGDLEPTLTWTASGLTNGDTVSVFTGALDRATGENVGTYLIGLGDLDAGSNYTTVLDAAPVTFEITKATVTVTPDSGQSKVYGDLEPTLTWTASGLTNGDTVSVFTGALDRATGENVGTYLIGLGDLDAGSNYTTVLDAAPVTFEITKATVTVTPDSGQSKVYGDLEPTLTWTASGLTNGDTVSVFTGALDRATGENVGTYLIGLGDLDAGSNYTTVLDAAPVTFEITKRALTIAAHGVDRMYDGTDVATVTFTDNRLSGDTLSIAYGSALFDDRNAGTAKTINVTGISISGTDAGNYTFNTTASTSADITQRSITVTAQANTKVADGNTSAAAIPAVSVSPIAAGDTAAFVETYDTPAASTGKTLTPSGVVNDGNSGLNYAYTFVPVATGIITPGPATHFVVVGLRRNFECCIQLHDHGV